MTEGCLKTTNKELNEKLKLFEQEIKLLTENNKKLQTEVENNISQINEFNRTISNLNSEINQKDKIINELKGRITDTQRIKNFNFAKNKNYSSVKDEMEDIYSYLNKSDDDILINSESHNIPNLLKKVTRYQLENKYLKDKIKETEEFGKSFELSGVKKKNKVDFNKVIFKLIFFRIYCIMT